MKMACWQAVCESIYGMAPAEADPEFLRTCHVQACLARPRPAQLCPGLPTLPLLASPALSHHAPAATVLVGYIIFVGIGNDLTWAGLAD